MLPINAFQMDYQDFGNFVLNHIDLIEHFENDNHLKFDLILAKLRNGTIPGSIISTHLNIPMGVVSVPRDNDFYEFFIPKNILDSKKELNVLFVDAICGTGKTLNIVEKTFKSQYPNINFFSYSTLVDVRSKIKPNICGLVHENFFQPPWEWRSFTPQSHLDRLLNEDIKSYTEDVYSVGFSSSKCKDLFEQNLGQKLIGEWIDIFNVENFERKISSASGVSSLSIPDSTISIDDGKTKFSMLINEKINFITNSGFTHFIENDVSQAILISEKCPVCHIIYFDGKNLVKIYGKFLNKEKFISLNF